MSEKLFSVITVVFNDKDNLVRILNSVRNQKKILRDEIEYIVIDGASKDGTLDIILSSENVIDKWISEPDKGLYDAMNKGINLASGKYLMFMNAGDKFVEVDTLLKVKKELEKNNYPDFIYGDALEEDLEGNLFLKKAYSHKYVWYGMFTHHQAIIYKKEIIDKFFLRYDLSFKLGADYAFTIIYLRHAKTIFKIDFPICIFKQDGLSQRKCFLGLKEQFLIRRKILKWPFCKILPLSFIHIGLLFTRKLFPKFYKILRFHNEDWYFTI